MRKTAILPLLIVLFLLGACGRGTPERMNVLLLVVDTLRADHLSLYGYPRPTSPYLRTLARESVVFTQARSPAGCTFPSANSLLTSREPSVFLLQPGGTMAIPATVRSLPEILRGHGYSTAAVSASPIARATPSYINAVGGFGRGFQTFDEECLDRHARCLNDKAAGLLQTLPQPWLLYLHYMEPHAPYRPPPDFPRRFTQDPGHPRPLGIHPWAWRGENWPVLQRIYDGKTELDFTPRDLAYLRDLYDEEIAYFDAQLAELVGRLRERGLLDHTLIVLAADHGEAQHEHGGYGHCRSLAWETVLRTPLLMRIPGAAPGVRRELVDNLDVVPTVLDYLGIPGDGLALDGVSLRPAIERDRPVQRLAFGNQGDTRTVTDGTRKLSYDLATGTGRLFDLVADPGETTDLAAQRPEEAHRLEGVLLRWMKSRESPAGPLLSRRRARELERQLHAVGYL
ncbi:MAG TPA: sulfatase [Thermoanaerobaculia bacterium]